MQPAGRAAIREAVARDSLAADLRCSLFTSALQSYKRDSALRPFPASYARHDCKDFEALLADASKLPNLKELLQSSEDRDKWAWDLLNWILSSKVLTVHSAGKSEFEKIQKLTGAPHTPVPVPDFLFEIEYSDPANAKFYETKGDRDLIYAFHGSRLENFHSILHNGLHCHLNKTSLFGEGTYLTSDLSLALIYSPHGHGWQRSLLGPILSCVAVCEVIDHPDVKCQTKRKDSKETDRRRARVKHSEGGDVPPKYFVVTNNQLLRVRYLLVYSQKQAKSACSDGLEIVSQWAKEDFPSVGWYLYMSKSEKIVPSNLPSAAVWADTLSEVILLGSKVLIKKRRARECPRGAALKEKIRMSSLRSCLCTFRTCSGERHVSARANSLRFFEQRRTHEASFHGSLRG